MSLARAIETSDATLLPSRRDEAWRWSDLRGLIRAVPAPSAPFEGHLPAGPFDALAADTVAVVNGLRPAAIEIAAGETRIVALRFVCAAGAGAHQARASVRLGEGASLTLLESYEGLADDYLAGAEITLTLAAGARLERIVLADDRDSGVNVSSARATLGPAAVLEQTVLTRGARRQRLETSVAHPGAGAVVRLDGVFVLGGRRHADITTVVTHDGLNGATTELIKGVVDGQARGVFQGRIVVRPGAGHTDARMGCHALILSDRAEVDAKPELEIFADDVACAHGNTVGALDEEAMFYIRQRGLSEAEARAMLTAAFLAEVTDRIGHEGAREAALAWLTEALA